VQSTFVGGPVEADLVKEVSSVAQNIVSIGSGINQIADRLPWSLLLL